MAPSHHLVVEDLSTPDYPAVVVEDLDGFRILHVGPTLSIPVRIWQQAYDAGTALIIFGDLIAISAEDFLAHRFESSQTLTFGLTGDLGLVDVAPGAGYRDYIAAQTAKADADPFEHVAFVHLHTHTEYSTLDGLSNITTEAVAEILKDPNGGGALGVADHGNCAAHPELQAACDKAGIKPIFGMEAYFVPDRHRRPVEWYELDGVRVDVEKLSATEKKKAERKSDAAEVKREYTHLTLWAEDNVGLRNLWAMSTEAYRDGLYDGKPRLDWDTLERHREGIIAGAGCLRGPAARPIADEYDTHAAAQMEALRFEQADALAPYTPSQQVLDTARQNLLRLHGIFGDRLFVEIHTNSLPQQQVVNTVMAQWCAEYGIEPIAAVDAHYARKEQRIVHKSWVASATGKTLADETTMFQGEQDYHLKTAEEVVESLIRHGLGDEFIHRSMTNTVAIARRCDAKVGGEVTTPTFSKASKEHPDPVARDVERLIEVCLSNWERKVVGKRHDEATYLARFEREIALLVQKGFCGYFLIVWDYVAWAKREGCLVGPGRGSGGGSLVAYLADIVETDPVENDLIFERFLTEGRNSLPDFDIDFPSSWRGRIIGYIKARWGDDYVANIGTISRLRTKAAINDTLRVLTPVLPYEVDFMAFEALKKAVTEADAPLAGKHLPWEEFKAQYADLVEPMQARYPEIFGLIDAMMDRVKTYGKHAAGVVISTGAPLSDLPMRLAKDTKTKTEVWVTQFDMVALEDLGYVKFDFLTLRTLDTLQMCIDLVKERFGYTVNPYDWKEELLDPQVWDEVSSGRTLGLFQIETASGTRLTKRMLPANLYDLAAVMTVVRPGPMRSGLTESYLRRRQGLEPVTYPDARLEAFLGDTYGSMIYQEQVMATCMNLAGYDSTEADAVRKLLGKKQVEKVVAAGEEFVRRAVECGTDQQVADTLWAQMAEFAKYGFNKAHAFAYAVLGYWCAFLRFHYPVEFLLAALSTVDADRIPEFIEDCRNSGYGVVPPHINRSQVEFSAKGMDVIYGLSMVKGIGGETAEQIVKHAPYASVDDFITRCVDFPESKVNRGHLRTLVEVGAFDDIIVNRRAAEQHLTMEAEGAFKRCQHKTDAPNPEHPFNLPCGFDWAGEPDPPLLPRGRGKAKTYVPKPPPKACNVRCRQFLPPPSVDPADVTPYSNDEIMRKERDLLGVWITHSPFDVVPKEVLDDENVFSAQQMEAAPAGTSLVGIGLIEEVKERRDKNGNAYAFVKMNLQDGVIEAICFASVYGEKTAEIAKDRLAVVEIAKNPRGYQLSDLVGL